MEIKFDLFFIDCKLICGGGKLLTDICKFPV
jgi:hypothetical protein